MILVIGAAMVVLGVVAIVMGFSYKYPDVHAPGAIHQGARSSGPRRVAWGLQRTLKTLKKEEKTEEQSE